MVQGVAIRSRLLWSILPDLASGDQGDAAPTYTLSVAYRKAYTAFSLEGTSTRTRSASSLPASWPGQRMALSTPFPRSCSCRGEWCYARRTTRWSEGSVSPERRAETKTRLATDAAAKLQDELQW